MGDVGPDSGKTDELRGPNGFDTINQVRKPGYFGWPYSRGNGVYREYEFEEGKSGEFYSKTSPVNDSPNNTGLKELPPVEAPMIWYESDVSEQFPLLGRGGRTACAGDVFHFRPDYAETDGFSEFYDGSLLFFDWQRPFLLWARMDGDANYKGIEEFSESARIAQGEDDGSGAFQIKRPIDAFFGKDGCLFLMDYGETWGKNPDARIVKVSYQRGNLSPKAVIALERSNGAAPLKVKFSGKESSDPEGGGMKYEWILNPGGRVIGNQ